MHDIRSSKVRRVASARPTGSEALIALGLAAGPVIALGFTRFAYALLLPSMRTNLHWSFAAAGGMNSANAAGYIAGAASAAWWSARFGSRRVFLFSLAISAALLAATGASGNYGGLAVVRVAGGLSTAVAFVVGSALASQIHSGGDHRRSAAHISIYMAGVGIGVVLSGLVVPVVTGTLDGAAGWRTGWVLLGALAGIALLPAAWALRRISDQPRRGVASDGRVTLRPLMPTVVWYVLFGAGYVSYMTFVIALLHANGASGRVEAAFFVVLGLSSVIGTLVVWGRLLGRMRGGAAPALISGLVLLGVLPVLLSHSLGAAMVSAVVFGASFMAGPTAATVLARRALPAHGWTTGIALLTVAFSVGQAFGPFFAGLLSDSSGGITKGLWLSVVLLGAAGVAALAQREPSHRAVVDVAANEVAARDQTDVAPFRRILLAVDGTPHDTPVEETVVALARSLDAQVDVLHVETESADWGADSDRDGGRSASQVLQAAVDRMSQAGVRSAGHLVHAPAVDIAEAIADAAADLGVDLVVAAPHHRNHLQHWLEPSVSEQLAQRSRSAVLLVA